MKLIDLDPHWIDYAGRRGLGVRFRCLVPGHCKGYLWILFSNPVDGGLPWADSCFDLMRLLSTEGAPFKDDRPCDECRWTRVGENFPTMSMTPSVNAHGCGHLTLTDGVFK